MAERPQGGRSKALERFPLRVRREVPKAVANREGLDTLTAFYDFPAEHWRHCARRPIESSFAT